MRSLRWSVCLLAALSAAQLRAETARAQPVVAGASRRAPVRFRLDNGLDVILDEKHDTPRVAVVVNYHVGARDQPEGHSGLAHMTEHMMFAWARGMRGGAAQFLDSVGAVENNGLTSDDSTKYYEVVHPAMLERVLAFESDRMGFLLDHIDAQQLEQQRRVVLREDSERSQWWVVPSLGRLMLTTLLGDSHPYRMGVELTEDVSALTLDHVRWFYQRWYVPSNATLVLVGDFDATSARRWIQRYFGGLARVARPVRAQQTWRLPGHERHLQAYAPSSENRVVIVYSTPALFADGDADLDLASQALTGHEFARLQRALSEQRLALAVSTHQSSMQLGSRFSIVARANTGVPLARLRAAIDHEIDTLGAAPIAQRELDALRAAYLLGVRRSDDTVLGRAMMLAQYAAMTEDNPDWFARDLQRYERVTPASLQRAVQTWLHRDHRVVATIHGSARGSGVVVTQPGAAP